MKKYLALLLAAIMVLSMFAACGTPNNPDTTAGNDTPDTTAGNDTPDIQGGDEPVDYVQAPDLSGQTIRIMTDESGWTTEGYAAVLPKFKQIEELTGCTIVWETITADYGTVLQTRIAGDPAECPDIVMLTDHKAPASYIEDGWVVPLSEYFDIIPNIEAWYNANPELKALHTYTDGEIYGLPNCAYSTLDDFNRIYAASGDHTFWYRADIARELGFEEVPSTLEEYEALMMAVKKAYPDMHPSEYVSMTGSNWASSRNWSAAFGLHFNFESTGSFYYPDANGKVQFEPATEAGLDWLTTMARWYENGLMYDAGDWTPYYANPGTGVSFSGFWNGAHGLEEQLKAIDADGEFAYMPFVPAEGYETTYLTRAVTCWSTIVVDNEDQDRLEAALKFLDFAFYSDYGVYSNRAGVMGEGWEFGENGEFVVNPDYVASVVEGYYNNRDSGADMWTRLSCLYDAEVTEIWNKSYHDYCDANGIDYNWENQYTYDTYMTANEYNFSHVAPAYPSYYWSEDDKEIISAYAGDISTFTDEYISKAILGEVDLANFQTEFVDVLYNQLHLQEILDLHQQYYDAYVASQG